MEAFRQDLYETDGFDFLNFNSMAALSQQSMLKMTKAQIELLTEEDSDIYMELEKNRRGGFCYVSQRYAKSSEYPCEGPEKPVEVPKEFVRSKKPSHIPREFKRTDLYLGDVR